MTPTPSPPPGPASLWTCLRDALYAIESGAGLPKTLADLGVCLAAAGTIDTATAGRIGDACAALTAGQAQPYSSTLVYILGDPPPDSLAVTALCAVLAALLCQPAPTSPPPTGAAGATPTSAPTPAPATRPARQARQTP
jgi:hypothetical protein